MRGEQAYYLTELIRVVFGLLPIALVLFAMIFLRRQERTPQTFWMQCLAGLWLLIAIASRLVLSRVVGLSILPQNKILSGPEEATEHMNFYFAVSSALHIAELAAFTLFAFALVIYFHQRLPKQADAPNQSLEPTASRSDV